ncbi:hypothetical protein ACO0E1_05755 [Curtobacterium sp. RRHDQ66]|uniref:hypothetical protein n=1 Tax=Curtobacterium guangdongense TaxID=3413380 RepID=UPI003BF0D043
MTTSRKRRHVALGASTLALATIAAGLTATSATAAPAPAADGRQQVGPLVTQTSPFQGADAFSSPTPNGAGAEIPANRSATLDGARTKAVDWIIPAAGSVTTVRPVSHPDLCLTAGSKSITNSSIVTLESCRVDDPAQRFSIASNKGSNNPIGTGIRSEYNEGFLGLYNNDAVMRLQTWTVADRVPTLDDFVAAFSATLDRVDTAARTAHLSGTGTPGAEVRFQGKAAPVRIDADGTWTAAVADLAIGANVITVTQHEGALETGRVEVPVGIDAAELTFETKWDSSRDRPVHAFGIAEPGAEVRLFNTAGEQIGEAARADASTGEWSTTIPAPNAGGEYAVTAAQFLAGVRDSVHDRSKRVDYGTAVAITSPTDGSTHTGGTLTLEGDGEQGSALTVYEVVGGTETEIGSGTVRAGGKWTIETTTLDRSEHVIRVEQRSKGANTTTSSVTVNPGQSHKLAPITLESPDEVTPGVTNTFSGTAEPDAVYQVLNPYGTVLIDGLKVGADGRWQFERVISSGAKEFAFKIAQRKGDIGPEESQIFRLQANNGFDPVTITTPTLRPGEVNTIEGTGPANATFMVLNASGKELEGPVQIGADGRWSFDRQMSTGIDKFQFKAKVTVDGVPPYTTSLFTIWANTR